MNANVRINSDGFRDREYSLAKNDKYRIIFLGDSLTFGWGVEEEDTFANILEEKLNHLRPTEIINFGTGNYNTEQEVNLFLEKGLRYRPDEAVLFYFINDAEATPKKACLWFLGYSRIITFYWSRIHELINLLIPSRSFRQYYANLYREDERGWKNAQKAFLQLKDACRKNGIELKVVTLPEFHNLENYTFKQEHALVSKFLKDNGIDCLDLAPFFARYENPMELWVARDDAHPNRRGHRLIAEYSFDFLSRR
jgi:lysophospholipase L1-like esterase